MIILIAKLCNHKHHVTNWFGFVETAQWHGDERTELTLATKSADNKSNTL